MSGVFGQATPWYVKIGTPDPFTSFVSTWFVGALRPWLLGVFFLVTGAIAARLYEGRHKGFTESRLVKLGIPSLLYIVLVNPLLVFAGRQGTTTFASFVTDEYLKFKVIGTGPLWFAIILFFCSISLPPIASRLKFDKIKFPSWFGIVIFSLILSAVTFFVRVWAPVGTYLWGFHLAFLPQFLVMPFVGMAAWQSGWLERTTNRHFWICLAVDACLYPCLAFDFISAFQWRNDGGIRRQSFVGVCAFDFCFVCFRPWCRQLAQPQDKALGFPHRYRIWRIRAPCNRAWFLSLLLLAMQVCTRSCGGLPCLRFACL